MGRTDAQRAKRYRDRKRGGPPRELEPCPSPAAYARHKRNQEEPCDACKRVEAERQNKLYEQRKDKSA